MKVLPLPRPSSAEQAKAFSPTSGLHFYALQNTITQMFAQALQDKTLQTSDLGLLSARAHLPFRPTLPSFPLIHALYSVRTWPLSRPKDGKTGPVRRPDWKEKPAALQKKKHCGLAYAATRSCVVIIRNCRTSSSSSARRGCRACLRRPCSSGRGRTCNTRCLRELRGL